MFSFFPYLPVAALLLFAVLPRRMALPIYLLFLGLSFYLTWRDMRAQRRIPPAVGKKTMIGDRALVVRVANEKVEVDYKGETWKVVSNRPLHPGQEVIIVRVEGLVLHVVPMSEFTRNEPSNQW